MKKLENITTIKERWVEIITAYNKIGDAINAMQPALDSMESIIADEDSRLARATIAELIHRAEKEAWCAFTYNPRVHSELMFQLGNVPLSARVETIQMRNQGYSVYLFFGQQGRDLLSRYMNGEVSEGDVMDITQQAISNE